MTATVIPWVIAALVALAAVWTHRADRRRLARMARENDHARAFHGWARYTALTVVPQSGRVHALTLHELWRSTHWDYVWDAPIAVSLWHGDPDTVHRYRREPGMITGLPGGDDCG